MAKSTFNAVLNDVRARHDQRVDADRRMARALGRFQALASAAVAPVSRGARQGDDGADQVARVRRAYTRAASVGVNEFTLAEFFERLDEAPTVDALRALRRTFAATRHPDRVGLAERQRATHEMQTANDLIDRAIERHAAMPGE